MSVQVPKGYKQTEVGVIPSDWSLNRLVDLAEIRSGIAKNANANITNPVSVYYLRVANVQDGFLDLSEMSQLLVSRDDIKRYAVMPNDMLMNEGGDLDKLGRGALWNGEFSPCIHQNHVFVVRCGKFLLPTYLKAWTGSTAARRYFLLAGRQTTNLASINKTSLGQLPIPLPPNQAEQQAIAEALSDADALIESLEQLIAKKRQIKQGAMQELLTGQRRLPGFSGEWKSYSVGDIADVKTGPFGSALHESDYVHEGTPIITVEHLGEYGVLYKNLPLVSDADCQRLSSYKLESGDIVFSRVGSIDRNALISDKEQGWLFSGRLLRLRVNRKQFIPKYLSYHFHSEEFKNLVLSVAVGQTMASLNTKILSGIRLKLPCMYEQHEIAEVLGSIDAEIIQLRNQLDKAREIKQSMMQELLTGHIRLL